MSIIDNTKYHTLITIDDNDTMQIECSGRDTNKILYTYVFKFNRKRLQNILQLSNYGYQLLLEIFKNKSVIDRLKLSTEQQTTLDNFLTNFKNEQSEHLQFDTTSKT